ncbi:MAG TPA: glycosyltransferase family 39 protein [Acidimicrobiia bacterium]
METQLPQAPPTPPEPLALEAAPRWGRRELLGVFAALLLLTMALRLPAFFVDVFNSDETFLATQAEVINDGGQLYQEAADRKPPLVPYLYAATFAVTGTTALWSVRVVAMLAVALTALLVAVEARRRYGPRAGWIGGVLLVFASVAFAPQDGQAANFEVFMLPAMTAGVLLARQGRSFSSGAAVAVATLAKQTGAATLLPVLYSVWRRRGRRGAGDALLGFAAPLALVALLVGPGQLLFWAVLGNGSYLSIRSASALVALMVLLMTLAFVALNLPILWTIPRAWARRRDIGRDDTDLWLWLLSAAVSVTVGLRFFGHYYLQLLPPLCLLTAGVLVTAGRRAVKRTIALAAFVAVVFSATGFFVRPFDDRAEYESVSRYIATHAGGDDRILVWGHVPEIYWASGKLPATRFPTTGFITGAAGGRHADDVSEENATPGAWDLFFEDFIAHPPRYILDTSPAKIRGSEYYPISAFPRLAETVFREYRPVAAIDGITVYERVPNPPFRTAVW